MQLPLTSMIALALSLLMIGLAFRVARLRVRNRIGLGVGGNKTLARAMAAHSNAVENIPLTLILFALAEFQGANTLLLGICGGTFILARILNAIGVSLYARQSFARFYGILTSWAITVILAIWNAWLNLPG